MRELATILGRHEVTAPKSPRFPGDQQQRRGLRLGWETEYRIASPPEKPAPSQCAVPDPMGSEVPLPGQFGRATSHPVDDGVKGKVYGFNRFCQQIETIGQRVQGVLVPPAEMM